MVVMAYLDPLVMTVLLVRQVATLRMALMALMDP
jgi:hypothetical protein